MAYGKAVEAATAFPKNVLFARVWGCPVPCRVGHDVPRPQIRVLPLAAAFVTHCGLNSVHEAGSRGVVHGT